MSRLGATAEQKAGVLQKIQELDLALQTNNAQGQYYRTVFNDLRARIGDLPMDSDPRRQMEAQISQVKAEVKKLDDKSNDLQNQIQYYKEQADKMVVSESLMPSTPPAAAGGGLGPLPLLLGAGGLGFLVFRWIRNRGRR